MNRKLCFKIRNEAEMINIGKRAKHLIQIQTDLGLCILVFLIFRAHFFSGFFGFTLLCCFVLGFSLGRCFLFRQGFIDFVYVFFGVCVCSLFCIEAAYLFLLKFYFSLARIFFLLGNEIFFSSKFPRFSLSLGLTGIKTTSTLL